MHSHLNNWLNIPGPVDPCHRYMWNGFLGQEPACHDMRVRTAASILSQLQLACALRPPPRLRHRHQSPKLMRRLWPETDPWAWEGSVMSDRNCRCQLKTLDDGLEPPLTGAIYFRDARIVRRFEGQAERCRKLPLLFALSNELQVLDSRRAPSPQGLANTTIRVITQKRTRMRSMTLSKVMGYF